MRECKGMVKVRAVKGRQETGTLESYGRSVIMKVT